MKKVISVFLKKTTFKAHEATSVSAAIFKKETSGWREIDSKAGIITDLPCEILTVPQFYNEIGNISLAIGQLINEHCDSDIMLLHSKDKTYYIRDDSTDNFKVVCLDELLEKKGHSLEGRFDIVFSINHDLERRLNHFYCTDPIKDCERMFLVWKHLQINTLI